MREKQKSNGTKKRGLTLPAKVPRDCRTPHYLRTLSRFYWSIRFNEKCHRPITLFLILINGNVNPQIQFRRFPHHPLSLNKRGVYIMVKTSEKNPSAPERIISLIATQHRRQSILLISA